MGSVVTCFSELMLNCWILCMTAYWAKWEIIIYCWLRSMLQNITYNDYLERVQIHYFLWMAIDLCRNSFHMNLMRKCLFFLLAERNVQWKCENNNCANSCSEKEISTKQSRLKRNNVNNVAWLLAISHRYARHSSAE